MVRGYRRTDVRSRLWASLPAPGRRAPPPDSAPSGLARSAYVRVAALAVVVVVLGVVAASIDGSADVSAVLLLMALFAGALAGGAVVLVQRRVGRPLRQLARMATQAAAGREVPPTPAQARGDLGPLGAAVGALVEEVERRRHIVLAGAILEASADLTVILAERGLITHASTAAAAMLGRPSAWLVGQSLAGLAHPEDRSRLEDLGAGLADATGPAARELRLSHLQGHWVVTEVRACDLRGDPDVGGIVLNIRDISVRKAHEEDLVRRALYDPLTGLANRALFREHVEKALARLRRGPALPHAVLFVDLDGFKRVNDSLGYAAGDEVLVEVGNRLRRWMRPGNTAGRLGGLGLKLAVDDFGTGYSSLSYLRSLPIDILKIDKSFVAGVTNGVEQSAVAQAVVKLARTFNLKTVAEGIEQPEQAARLLAIGADMGQGYLFSRPLTAPSMGAFLANGGIRERAADVDLRTPTAVAG